MMILSYLQGDRQMGSLTFLLIISVVSYLIYYTYKEVTRPLSSSLKDDIKKIKDKTNKINKIKKD